MKNQLYALILAAGKSSRYGKNKILEKINDKTFLEIILEKVEKFNLIPIIVYYYDEIVTYNREGRIFVKNVNPDSEQLDSIRLGIGKMDKNSTGFLLFLGDMPLISDGTIKEIINEIKKDSTHIIIPEYRGKSGHPTYFPSRYFDRFFDNLRDGARSLVHNGKTKRIKTNDIFTVIGVNNKEEFRRYVNEYKGTID